MKELSNIPGLEPEKTVKIKKFTYGDKNKLSSKCVSIDFKTKTPHFDLALYRSYVLIFGITEAPFELDIKGIEDLLSETGEYLFKEILDYNNMGDGAAEFEKK